MTALSLISVSYTHLDVYKRQALCCVDLRKHKHEDLENLPTEIILECTNVKMGIGEILNPMLKAILEADNRSDDEQIKISEYRSNMGASIFEKGDSLDVLLNTIETKIRQKLSSMPSYSTEKSNEAYQGCLLYTSRCV